MLKFTEEQARLICWGDDDDYKVISDEILSKGRWDITSEIIIQNRETGKFYIGWKTVGATEYQDTREYCTEWSEVEEYEKTIKAYRPVNRK